MQRVLAFELQRSLMRQEALRMSLACAVLSVVHLVVASSGLGIQGYGEGEDWQRALVVYPLFQSGGVILLMSLLFLFQSLVEEHKFNLNGQMYLRQQTLLYLVRPVVIALVAAIGSCVGYLVLFTTGMVLCDLGYALRICNSPIPWEIASFGLYQFGLIPFLLIVQFIYISTRSELATIWFILIAYFIGILLKWVLESLYNPVAAASTFEQTAYGVYFNPNESVIFQRRIVLWALINMALMIMFGGMTVARQRQVDFVD